VPANTRDVVVPRLVIPTAVFESEIAAAIAKDADRARRVFDRSPPQAHLVMELILINTRTMAPGQRLGRRYILLPTAAPLSAFNSPILTEIVAKSGENEMDTTNAEDFTGTILELRIQNAQPAN
jgi:hypothetical protein